MRSRPAISDRTLEGVLWTPASPKSCLNNSVFNFKPFGHFGHTCRNSVNRKHSISASISRLLNSGTPFAVGWIISLVVIFSIYAKAARWIAHIGVKILKRHPAFTYRNSPATIPMPIVVTWVRASLNHSVPYVVNWSVSLSVSQMASELKKHLSSATAGCSSFVLKLMVRNPHLSPTVALTKAMCSVVDCLWIGENKKVSKSKSNEGYWFTHGIGSFNVVSAVGGRLQPALTAII